MFSFFLIPTGSGQDNFNFSFEDEVIPNPIKMLVDDDTAYISSIRIIDGVRSSIIYSIDLSTGELSKYELKGFQFSRNGFWKEGKTFIAVGDYFLDTTTKFFVGKFDSNFEILDTTLFINKSGNGGIVNAAINSDNIYCISADDIIPEFHRQINIHSFDSALNYKWDYNYNSSLKATYTWESAVLNDQLILSNAVIYNELSGRYSQINAIDDQGNIVWEYLGTDEFLNIASPAWMCILENGNIVQSFEIDKSDDQEFMTYNYDLSPTKLLLFSDDGELIDSSLLTSPLNEEESFLKLRAISQNNFIGIGAYNDYENREYRGFISKLNASLDTVWTKIIHHSKYQNGERFEIRDIVELPGWKTCSYGNNKQIWLRSNTLGLFP